MLNSNKYKCLIFDLDDTLADTSGQLLMPAVSETLNEMLRFGLRSSFEGALDYYFKIKIERPESDSFAALIDKFGLSDENIDQKDKILNQCKMKFYSREIPNSFHSFTNVPRLLSNLKTKYALFLVTSGEILTQRRKVEVLQLGSFFNHIFYVNFLANERKVTSFRKIISQLGTSADTFLCIGNRLDQEIADAKSLGMKTCYIMHGEYKDATPKTHLQIPDYKVQNISEIIEACNL